MIIRRISNELSRIIVGTCTLSMHVCICTMLIGNKIDRAYFSRDGACLLSFGIFLLLNCKKPPENIHMLKIRQLY